MAGAALAAEGGRPDREAAPSGMSTDQMRNMRNIKEGAVFDGSKSERKLGLAYTPKSQAIQEEVASHRR